MKRMYYGSSQLFQLIIFIFLICFVDLGKILSYADKPLSGQSLLTSFSEILLQFSICRDFFIMTVLFCSDQALKFALNYRFAACLVDFVGILLVGSYSTALMQEMNIDSNPTETI